VKLLRGFLEALRSALFDLLRRPLSSLVSMLAMALALFLLASFLATSRGVESVLDKLAEDAVVEVYFDPAAALDQIESAAKVLEADTRVASSELIRPERAIAEFRALYPDLGQIEDLLGTNPFPYSLRLEPRSSALAPLQELVASAQALSGVDAVRYDQEWIAALTEATAAAGWIALAGAAILLLAAWTIVGAVVRLALDDKRDEVDLLRMVGASASFVIAPVLLGGALLGGSGGLLAVQAARLVRGLLLRWSASTPLAGFASLLAGEALSTHQVAALVIFGIASGAVAAALAAGRAALR
jgi:cell division transport system permease protein